MIPFGDAGCVIRIERIEMLESNRNQWRTIFSLMLLVLGGIFLYEDKSWEAYVCLGAGLLGLLGVNIFVLGPLDKRLDKLSRKEIAVFSEDYKRDYVLTLIFCASLSALVTGILGIVVVLLPDSAESWTAKFSSIAFCAFIIGLGALGCWKYRAL